MKNYIFFLIVFPLILSACSNYLDQDPEQLNSIEKIFSSREDTRKWFARIYSDDYYPNELFGSAYYNHYMFATDDSNNALDWHIPTVVQGMLSPDQPTGDGYDVYYFVRFYQAIRHCNIFLENVDKCEELGLLEKERMVAEARFMRAMYHFWILRDYGPIPIVDQIVESSNAGKMTARNSMDECVQWIGDEMLAAIPNMPEERVEDDYGFPTKAAAMAMRSRLLLIAASPQFNGNSVYANWKNNDGKQLINQTYDEEKWLVALNAAKEVIDLGKYELLMPKGENGSEPTFDEYVDNFRSITTTWNKETIWARPAATSWWTMQSLPAVFHSWNARNGVTLNLANAFFMSDGSVAPELEYWFNNKQWSAEDGNGTISNTFKMFCDREPRFYATLHFPNQRLSYATKTKPNVYQTIEFWYDGNSGKKVSSGDHNSTGLSPRKNIPMDATSDKSEATTTSNNIPFPTIRLGEIYLNYCEAMNEYYGVQRQEEILFYLNAIRERAGLGKNSYNGTYSQEQMREMIRHERRVELAFEIHRYFDVRRWFIAHGEHGVFNSPVYGLDVSRGANATDPSFFTMVEGIPRYFRLEHYLAPIKASEAAYNTELIQAPFY